ncbi:craniofacial development protein 1-like [Plakobranchus ocellatus]|uniref:Craniofacial development protein 1 n=1 Tax=Plakobranchus ocellatus TaxID=259542 RepID=A0AAV4DYA3_9GAST|nr:craniofacial development protein 1-like [Plakobranchus ocellatus]
MSDEEEYNSEEDQDYVPSEGEQVSEEENSGEEEDLSLLQDDSSEVPAPSKKKTSKSRKGNIIQSRKRRGGIKLDAKDEETSEEIKKKEIEESEEEAKRRKELAEQAALEEQERQKEKEKKRADDLWSSFLADVKPTHRKTGNTASAGLGSLTAQVKSASEQDSKSDIQSASAGKVKITKVFDFAGEEIKVTKEVDADSREAKAEQKKQEKTAQENSGNVLSGTPNLGSAQKQDLKRPAVGGLSSVLSKIGKKNKMGTLEKSKIDWDSFKKKEGIEEDLKIHNKGKQGYTERMAFLNRTDQRQFELERELRLGSTSKR